MVFWANNFSCFFVVCLYEILRNPALFVMHLGTGNGFVDIFLLWHSLADFALLWFLYKAKPMGVIWNMVDLYICEVSLDNSGVSCRWGVREKWMLTWICLMCLEACSLLCTGTCLLINSMHFLGVWRERHFCSVGECLPSLLLKADKWMCRLMLFFGRF